MALKQELKLKTASKLLEDLNAEQKEAVTHREGPLLIVAGAGTGKTTVITRRIAYLIEQGVRPDEILALAFNDKAAAEMEERVDQLVPYGFVDVNIGTFHSFGQRILEEKGLEIGLPDFKVLDEAGQWRLIRDNLDEFKLDYYRPLGNPTKFIRALANHFSRLKDELVTPEEYLKYAEKLELAKDNVPSPGLRPSSPAGGEDNDEVARIRELANAYHVYQRKLLEKRNLDFGDLINYSLKLFLQRPRVLEYYRNRFKYILVDEFQDTNFALYNLIKILAGEKQNITVVGDDDQSIYKFRGASISNILKFKEDYPKAKSIFLTENYRSTQKILDMAHDFIKQNNPDRLEEKLKISKKLRAGSDKNGSIQHFVLKDYLEEAEVVVKQIEKLKAENNLTYNDFGVMARSNNTLNPVIVALEAAGIPYMYFASSGLYSKPIIQFVISYFKLLDNYHEGKALYKVLTLPVYQISLNALIELNHYASKKSLSMFEAVKEAAVIKKISEDDLKGIARFLTMLEKHAGLAKKKNAYELFCEIFKDLEMYRFSETDARAQKYVEAFEREIKKFVEESDDRSIKALMQEIEFDRESGEEGRLQFDPDEGPEAVKLMTVHGAKGLEFDTVFMISLVDKRFPSLERRDPIEIPQELIKDILPSGDAHLQEERRLFYVGLTRAKSNVILTRALNYGGKRTKKPSRFLVETDLAKEEKSLPTGQVLFKKTLVSAELPIPKSFSFSQINIFERCPLEYKYTCVIKMPLLGNPYSSYGTSMHNTLQKFLNYCKQNKEVDLFGKSSKTEFPSYDLLKKFYKESWIDLWFKDKLDKENYQKRGERVLKQVYEILKDKKPDPKYLEKPFKVKIKEILFRGTIDRADNDGAGGIVIIDYKTGKPKNTDKEQLMLYQWAFEEFYKEKVARLENWYLRDNVDIVVVNAERTSLDETKEKFWEKVQEIIKCITEDSFYEKDLETAHDRECQYRFLES